MVLYFAGIFPQSGSTYNLRPEVISFNQQNIIEGSSDEIKKLNKKMLGNGYLIVENIRQDWNGSNWVNYLKTPATIITKIISRCFVKYGILTSGKIFPGIIFYIQQTIYPTRLRIRIGIKIKWNDDFRYVYWHGEPIIRSLAVNLMNNYVFAGTYGAGVFLSTDDGANWTQKNNGMNKYNNQLSCN